MKEAVSELNSTVVVVVAVAGFAAFFFSYLWPMINNTLGINENCSKAICKPCEDGINCEVQICYNNLEDFESSANGYECVYKG